MKKIAIIGAGVSGLCSFYNLVTKWPSLEEGLSITLYDQRPLIGPGIPYQHDSDVLLLNRASKQMSIVHDHPRHFLDWYESKSEYKVADSEFLPRKIFGHYLKACFEQTVEAAKEKQMLVEVKFEEVTNMVVMENKRVTLESASGLYEYDYILLCIGHTELGDPYQLQGEAHYIHNPYPLAKHVQDVQKDAAVAIIGTSLTAVDAALVLKQHGHRGTIYMLSRSGMLPDVRGEIVPYQLKYVTEDYLAAVIKKNGGWITFHEIIEALHNECLSEGLHLKEIVKKREQLSNMERLQREMNHLEKVGIWQSILLATNEVIESYWRYLKPADKTLYLKKYERFFMSKRNPMPVQNAQKIVAMLQEDTLRILKHIEKLVSVNEKFVATFRSGEQVAFDWVINATGFAKDVARASKGTLLQQLLASGIVERNQYGGINIDFANGSVVSKAGSVLHNVKALGQITCGTYYFTSSVEMVAKHATQVIDDIVQQMKNKSFVI
ncbi:hypothetical protein A374_19350 [Fictibacillus macauensis ZFHKF-1]|uniref:FAD-dependent urate hydroxylase HpyO/Asp monooxygenase CreE-like FAD/NAD(P)-binding domain-containing protein n=1 Tax=Fictibacillus macauensis ZFHKF-1 TaxID=1196324 RepID=I8UA85_9BACL|nr:FAD/NAD(P)-binding protein [Fictibacillus macauensis]EIT83708.1 hypothetical protein A374_19350 [Fictibacillus macauensis ZFHKF-1]